MYQFSKQSRRNDVSQEIMAKTPPTLLPNCLKLVWTPNANGVYSQQALVPFGLVSPPHTKTGFHSVASFSRGSQLPKTGYSNGSPLIHVCSVIQGLTPIFICSLNVLFLAGYGCIYYPGVVCFWLDTAGYIIQVWFSQTPRGLAEEIDWAVHHIK